MAYALPLTIMIGGISLMMIGLARGTVAATAFIAFAIGGGLLHVGYRRFYLANKALVDKALDSDLTGISAPGADSS